MNNREPPRPAVILATPVNVEESRAQRLQRQQARFRDRGGIFVPSSRNTLADILLGKALPLKKPRRSRSRSLSASPTKRKGNGPVRELKFTASNAATTRTSPRKKGRKSESNAKTTATPVKASKKLDGSTQELAVSSKVSTKRLESQSTSKSKSLSAKSTSTSTIKSKDVHRAEDIDENHEVVVSKSKSKAKKASKSKASTAAVHKVGLETQTKPTITASATVSSTISSTLAIEPSEPRPTRSRRKSDLYSDGFSEDEYKPKQSNKSTKAKKKGATSSKTKSTTASKPITVPSKQAQAGTSRLADIPEEDEEEQEDAIQHPPVAAEPISSHKNISQGKKRVAHEADIDQDSNTPPKKRAKNHSTQLPEKKAKGKGTKKIPQNDVPVDGPKKKGSKSKKVAEIAEIDHGSKAQESSTSKKRPRVEDGVDGPKKKESKRKKITNVLKDDVSASKDETNAGKSSKKATKSTSKRLTGNIKGSSHPVAKTGKRKENSPAPGIARPQVGVPVKRGPPKRVLQRIMECQPHDVDNEPDPIDFLS